MGETNIANGSWQLAVGVWQNHQPQRAQRFLFCLLIFEKNRRSSAPICGKNGFEIAFDSQITQLPDYSITNSSSASSANSAVNGFGFALGLGFLLPAEGPLWRVSCLFSFVSFVVRCWSWF